MILSRTSSNSAPFRDISSFDRWLVRITLTISFVVILAFGALVEYRSAFLKRRMTDLDVYLRAAWAVRTGNDIYTITDENGWHYHYPSLLAIVLVPLADAPAGVDRTAMLPFGASVAIWYVLSVGCLFLAVHSLASALENTISLGARGKGDGASDGRPEMVHGQRESVASPVSRLPSRGSELSPLAPRPLPLSWWLLRAIPLVVCLPPVGHTLMRGQVNLLLLAFLAFMAAAYIRGRRGRAGLWLSAAICLKIIPAFLLIYPIWRRDLRSIATCALGLIVGLGIIPASVFGPRKTFEYYLEWDKALRQPALADGQDRSRAKELIDITATDSQSYLAVSHNLLNWDRITRPAKAASWVRLGHWVLGGALTALTLAAAGLRTSRRPEDELLFLGGLILMMILLSPVCHLHYFCLVIPLVMAMTARLMNGSPSIGFVCVWSLAGLAYLGLQVLPQLPKLEMLRDAGLAMFASLVLWAVAVILLYRGRVQREAANIGREPFHPLHAAHRRPETPRLTA